MTKFHINDQGEVNSCHAIHGNCPFGDVTNHFDSKEEGLAAYEARMNSFNFIKISMPKSVAIRKALVDDPLTDDATLNLLASDPSYEVRATLARKPKLPAEALEKLSWDAEAKVRAYVGMNKELPLNTRLRLAQDPEPIVQDYAAKVYPLPTEVAVALSYSHYPASRRNAIWSTVLPKDELTRLSEDEDSSVASLAKEKLQESAD